MKKFKRILPFLLALIMAVAIPVAGCDSCGETESKKILQSISVDTENAKTVFAVGEEFTAEGLVVKASFSTDGSESLEEVTLSGGDYQIDSSAYKKDELGTYLISVSYTYEDVSKSGSYEVMVKAAMDGLEVTLAEGVSNTYKLSASQTTAEIDTSKIVVKNINQDGTVGDVTSGYTTKLFKGQEEIALTGDKAVVGSGAYAIWVEKASEIVSGYTRSAFVLVYVNDEMVSFAKKDGTFTQDKGADVISNTWTFTATYVTGATKEISASECDFEIDTMTVQKDAVTTVSYTDYDASGESVTKTVDVTYTINRVYGVSTNTFDFNAIDNTKADNDELGQSDLVGANSFLKIGSGSAKYKPSANAIEIKNVGFQVTFEGTGTIAIGFGSTGGKNWSRVGLQDVGGNYIKADCEESATLKADTITENLYQVYGTAPAVLTFEISKPGTYSIVVEPNKDLGMDRGGRVYSIEMIETIDDPANTVCNVDFTDKSKFGTGNLATQNATAPVEIKDLSGASTGLSVTKSTLLNANRITDIDGVRVLQLQGAVTPEQNSLIFNVKSGKIKITVRYSNNTAGRYLDIINESGTVLASSSSLPTVAGGNIVEYTVELEIADDMPLYLGSHSGQINIAYLKVEKA